MSVELQKFKSDEIYLDQEQEIATSFGDIKSMVKQFLKQAVKHWFKHATGKDLDDPKIYESVRATVARNFRSVWEIRMATGELTY